MTKTLLKINVLHRPYPDGIWDFHVHIPIIIKKLMSVYYRAVY